MKSKTRLFMIESERHGRLVFLESLGVDHEFHSIGRFRCDCGSACVKRLAMVRFGNTRSCGCLQWEARRRSKRGDAGDNRLGGSPDSLPF